MKTEEAHKPEWRRYLISKTEVYDSQLWNDQNDRKGEGKKAGRKKEKRFSSVLTYRGLSTTAVLVKSKKNKQYAAGWSTVVVGNFLNNQKGTNKKSMPHDCRITG